MAFRCAFKPFAFVPTLLALAALGALVLYLRS